MAINVWSQTAKELGASYIGIGSGESWTDDSGNGHTGVLSNGASLTGSVLDLDGSDDFVTVTGHADLALTEEWTLEFSITPRPETLSRWLMVYGPTPAVNGFLIGVAGSPVSRIEWRFSENSDSISGRTPTGSIAAGVTTHVLAVVNGVAPNKAAVFYVDGVAVANTLLAADVPDTSANLLLGKIVSGSNYNGLLHGVSIYPDLAMSATQAADRSAKFLTHPVSGGGGGGG